MSTFEQHVNTSNHIAHDPSRSNGISHIADECSNVLHVAQLSIAWKYLDTVPTSFTHSESLTHSLKSLSDQVNTPLSLFITHKLSQFVKIQATTKINSPSNLQKKLFFYKADPRFLRQVLIQYSSFFDWPCPEVPKHGFGKRKLTATSSLGYK